MSLFVAVTLLLSLYRWPISISIIYCVYMIFVCILNGPLLNSVFMCTLSVIVFTELPVITDQLS